MPDKYSMHEMEVVLFRDSDEFAGCWDGSTYDDGKTDQESVKTPVSDI
ncbi:MAG: hypothetical protein LIP11_14710 [Clostridiales bacterium]|nr:hypothetical protein [Clostridiales bacterium]